MGTRFLLTKESTVPEAVKKIYLDTPVTGTVVTTSIDGHPQRVIKTPFVQSLEGSSVVLGLFRALNHAWRFRSLTKTSMWSLFREGLAMKKSQELTFSQMAMAANAPMLTRASMVEGRPEVGILPTGQGVGVMDELPTVAELIARVMAEAEATLAELTKLTSPPALASAEHLSVAANGRA
jgi:NAD(P)H-dependent flavin oxidoreductase YrpB (nitropropane dioxygenase family)